MMKRGAPTSINGDLPGGSWRRLAEWIWRSAAIRQARADARPLDASERASVGRARTFAALAERHLAEREPWTHGADGTSEAAVDVALALYRDAATETRAALGEAPATEPTTSAQDARQELDSLRSSVRAQLDELARRSGDVEPLLAQRFVRVGAVLAALGLLAVTPKLAWYAAHPDLAPDAPWTASSAAAGYASTGRGFAPSDFKIPIFFHTEVEPSPSVTFDLARIVDVRAVTVVNRGDCCEDRAVPMVIEVSEDNASWTEVAQRRETFRRWEARFARTTARWVRLRATRRTHLHLESVAIR
jgi:hypothetical protein